MHCLLLTGCEKFLDTERQGGYDADNYPYPGGSGPYDQYIFGAYNELRNFNVHSQSFITLPAYEVMMLTKEVHLRMVAPMQLIWIISRFRQAMGFAILYG